MILVLKEDVDDGGHKGIQEGKDGNGDEELCGGRVVSDEKDTVGPDPLAGWRLEGHLVQPEGHREPQTSTKRLIFMMTTDVFKSQDRKNAEESDINPQSKCVTMKHCYFDAASKAHSPEGISEVDAHAEVTSGLLHAVHADPQLP